jgi:hypothetical protein
MASLRFAAIFLTMRPASGPERITDGATLDQLNAQSVQGEALMNSVTYRLAAGAKP